MANIISEITATSGYTGNSALGGSTAQPSGVTLDTKPLESLAHYVFFYNRNLHEEKRQDADARAKELAELAKFNPDNALPQDKKAALEAWNQIVTFGNDYARKPLTGSGKDNLKQLWDFKTKINGTLRLVDHVNKRAVSYQTQKAAIDARTDITEGQKELMVKDLDKLAATDVTVDIPTLPAFDMKIPEIGKAALDSLEVSTNIGNEIVSTSMDVFNPRRIRGQASAEVIGLNNLFVSPESEQYKTANEGQKRQYDFAAKSNNAFRFYKDAEVFTAQALNDEKYKTDGKIDPNKVISSNAVLAPIYKAAKEYKIWAANMRQQASKGVFVDHLGRNFKAVNPVSPEDFVDIDLDKPLSADDMLMVHKWAESPKLTIKSEKILSTDDEIQRRGQDLDYDAAMARIKAGENTPLPISDYQPFQSILSSVGGVNKQVPLNKLSTAQIGAINPTLLNEKGQLADDYKNMKVSIGSNGKEYGVFLFNEKGERKAAVSGDTQLGNFSGEMITPSSLLSNASSWLATFGKELKGQDAYRFQPDAFTNAFNNDVLKAEKNVKTGAGNNPAYYGDPANLESESGGVYRYKDGTRWEVKDGKLKPIK